MAMGETDQNLRFMDALSEYAEVEFQRHQSERKDWNYHDILTRDVIGELVHRDPIDVEPDVRMIYLGNLVVEKGHAEYDRVTSEVFQGNEVFRKWKNTWVAEEEPHGASMQEWAMIRGLLSGQQLHEESRGYLMNGLTLSFPDAAFGLVYPALQEPATKLTHKAVKDRLPDDETEGRKILSKIIADEERHERFYANMVRHALETDDREVASAQMKAVAKAVFGFAMPGIESDIPSGKQITESYIRSGAFSIGSTILNEVILPAIDGEGTHGWAIADREELDDEAKKAQEDLVQLTSRIKKADGREIRLLAIMASGHRAYGKVA